MVLRSLLDFVLEQVKKMEPKEIAYLKIFNYAKFLKKPLRLEMFVPCDAEGNVLKNPGLIPSQELKQYRQAKEKVLFKLNGKFLCKKQEKGVEIKDSEGFSEVFYTVQQLTEHLFFSKGIYLTEPAIKQLGL